MVSDSKAKAARLIGRVGDEAYFARLAVGAGIFGLDPPRRVAQIALALKRFGLLGGAVTVAALRHGDRTALIDERGQLTYRDLNDRTNALAKAWRGRGLRPGEGVAVLARNHCGLLEAVLAAAKCGAHIVLLNTAFAGPQIREVAQREGTDLLVYDEEYGEAVDGVRPPRGKWRAWHEGPGEDTLDALIASAGAGSPPPPGVTTRITILTSGTTGTPRGAPRAEPRSLSLVGSLLDKVPFRARETTVICVPLFHSLGFSQAVVGIGLGSTLVVARRFDPEQALRSMAAHRASAMVVVPVLLRRLLDVDPEVRSGLDLSALRIVFVSGSALGADLARRALEAFGPVVYDLYGSTEVAYATIATPEDLVAAPGTVGRVVRGSAVKVFDDDGRGLPPGKTGRVFVGNVGQFEGYTGGGTKEQVGGLMASGDVGHFDSEGRLFIDGRDDEMIISGGENVFPAEVEELLAGHDLVQEAAVIGVEDEQFGQRLRAFVVAVSGAGLSEEEVKRYVGQNLARYKTPREVIFLEALPRNATGKVLKRELANHEP